VVVIRQRIPYFIQKDDGKFLEIKRYFYLKMGSVFIF